jgi:hypothetical protein
MLNPKVLENHLHPVILQNIEDLTSTRILSIDDRPNFATFATIDRHKINFLLKRKL